MSEKIIKITAEDGHTFDAFQAIPQGNAKGGLVIQADSESKVEKVLAIMNAARKIGINQVAIASEEG